MNRSMQPSRIALGFIEAGLTIAGIVAAITPLALWASWSETVFYPVLSAGCAAFLVFIGLARVRGFVMGETVPPTDVLGLKGVRQRLENWDKLQEQDHEVGRKQRSIKGDVGREFGFMMRVAVGLILAAAVVFIGVWAMFEFYYGA